MLSLLKKDVICLLRSPGVLASSIGFAILLVAVASFSFRTTGMSEEEMLGITPGILWLIFLFLGVTVLNYAFQHERENSALEGVVLSPVLPGAIFCAKFVFTFSYLFVLQALTVFVHALIFGVEMTGYLPGLLLVTFLVTLGFVAVGIPLAAGSSVFKSRDVVLPLILFPLCLPLMASAVFLSRGVLDGVMFSATDFWFSVLIVQDVVFLALSYVLFEYAINE